VVLDARTAEEHATSGEGSLAKSHRLEPHVSRSCGRSGVLLAVWLAAVLIVLW
jgi:hypothetical protein